MSILALWWDSGWKETEREKEREIEKGFLDRTRFSGGH